MQNWKCFFLFIILTICLLIQPSNEAHPSTSADGSRKLQDFEKAKEGQPIEESFELATIVNDTNTNGHFDDGNNGTEIK